MEAVISDLRQCDAPAQAGPAPAPRVESDLELCFEKLERGVGTDPPPPPKGNLSRCA